MKKPPDHRWLFHYCIRLAWLLRARCDTVLVPARRVSATLGAISGIGWLDEAKAMVASHHEKWDGSGYPRRLAGNTIPLAAWIFAVADVFDALCSRRPYKEPMNFEAAMSVLETDTGTHFDPAVMDAFRPIARDVFNTLAPCNEDDVRLLLEARVRAHFGI